MTTELGLPRNSRLIKDNIHYRQFDIKGGQILLTAEGDKLLHSRSILSKLQKYLEEIRTKNSHPDSRIYLREGGNGRVYLVGDLPLAIKEMSNSKSTESTLARLEILRRASKAFPAHIKVPIHYGILSTGILDKEYLLMEKINDGLNVMDIIDQPERFGDAGTLAIKAYNKAKDEVIVSLTEQGLDPDLYIEDWKEENVLVDFSKPSSPLPFTLWIIDQ